MTSVLLKKACSLRNLEAAWRVIRRNARTSKSEQVKSEIEQFAEDAGHNLRSICTRLSKSTFKFEPAKGIQIPKLDERGRKTGKVRPIVLAPVESRIVQRALLNVLVDLPALQPFIQTPYSFGGMRKKSGSKGRGSIAEDDELSAVPAAISALLVEIGGGAKFYAAADIRSFFTRISKTYVTQIISSAVEDSDFIQFLQNAIRVELSNMAELREGAKLFPIEDIGVAQGNSLSTLLGNVALAEFDRLMNRGDCKCIRYIDDFIILAPSAKAANARLNLAKAQLKKLGMELSPEKSSKLAQPISNGFEFLGIEILPGIIRPGKKAQAKLLKAVQVEFSKSQKAFEAAKASGSIDRVRSLVATLKHVDGMIDGWGKHYWFCNDNTSFANIDSKITEELRVYIGAYASAREKAGENSSRALLGVGELTRMPRKPFEYPSTVK